MAHAAAACAAMQGAAAPGAPSSSGRAPSAAWVPSSRCRPARAAPRRQQQLVAAQAAAAEATGGAFRTAPTRRLSPQEAFEALYTNQHAAQRAHYAAFYSSELGGIVTDPALMVVGIDDHMLHRGHGVFDTALLVQGQMYQLDAHLARLLASAARASIPLPRGLSVEQLRRTVLETAAASCKLDGYVRYWLSAGRGGFGLSSTHECASSAFYCMVYTHDTDEDKLDEYLRGWRVKTSPVPVKPSYFAAIKSNNYLPNVLALMDAEAEGFQQGIFVDEAGNVAEGPNMNLCALLHDGTVVVPPFEHSLAGITVQRMMALLPEAIAGGIEGIRGLEQRPLSVEEAKAAREVFLVGSSLPVMPVVQWDGTTIGDGTAGLGALQLRVMLQEDAKPREGGDQHTEVPYGYLTGML